jgi:hypothetical protein
MSAAAGGAVLVRGALKAVQQLAAPHGDGQPAERKYLICLVTGG